MRPGEPCEPSEVIKLSGTPKDLIYVIKSLHKVLLKSTASYSV